MSDLMNVSVMPQAQNSSAMTIAESMKGMQEIHLMCTMAWQRPRDVTACYTAVMKELERYSLAKMSMFSFPRGGNTVSGPSIKMIEMIARNFKNLEWGTKILNRTETYAECLSYCWDLESNNRKSIPFTVKFVRDTKQGPKPLTDERDIYELVQNYGQRRVRSCIQTMIPVDIIEDAKAKVKETIEKGEKHIPYQDRVRNMVMTFASDFQVSKEMIEARYNHSVDDISKEEMLELFGIANALREKQAKREDYFVFVTDLATTPQEVTAAAMKEKETKVHQDLVAELKQKYTAAVTARGGLPESEAEVEAATNGIKLDQIEKLPRNALLALSNVLKTL
jgi:hypothetical protein